MPDDASLRRNIEIKARLADLADARGVAARIADRHAGLRRQRDTYFSCSHGRLKLREETPGGARLIWYVRPDEEGPKQSDYRLVEVADGPALRAALTAALGKVGVVEKDRDVYLQGCVRIHLDEVVGLGIFLELEAVLAPHIEADAGREQVERLLAEFEIPAASLLRGSYRDLLRIA